MPVECVTEIARSEIYQLALGNIDYYIYVFSMTLTRLFAKSYQTTYKFEFFAMNTKLTILSTLTLKTFSRSKTNYLYYDSIWGSLDQESNAQPTELTCHMF